MKELITELQEALAENAKLRARVKELEEALLGVVEASRERIFWLEKEVQSLHEFRVKEAEERKVVDLQNQAMRMLLEQAACDFHVRHMKLGDMSTSETCDLEPCAKIRRACADKRNPEPLYLCRNCGRHHWEGPKDCPV